MAICTHGILVKAKYEYLIQHKLWNIWYNSHCMIIKWIIEERAIFLSRKDD